MTAFVNLPLDVSGDVPAGARGDRARYRLIPISTPDVRASRDGTAGRSPLCSGFPKGCDRCEGDDAFMPRPTCWSRGAGGGGSRAQRLPAYLQGGWYDWHTGRAFRRWRGSSRIAAPLGRLPVFVQGRALIPLGNSAGHRRSPRDSRRRLVEGASGAKLLRMTAGYADLRAQARTVIRFRVKDGEYRGRSGRGSTSRSRPHRDPHIAEEREPTAFPRVARLTRHHLQRPTSKRSAEDSQQASTMSWATMKGVTPFDDARHALRTPQTTFSTVSTARGIRISTSALKSIAVRDEDHGSFGGPSAASFLHEGRDHVGGTCWGIFGRGDQPGGDAGSRDQEHDDGDEDADEERVGGSDRPPPRSGEPAELEATMMTTAAPAPQPALRVSFNVSRMCAMGLDRRVCRA
ncbi:hypothetical protein FQR65_LT20918 [Abscondita terminalis]|nr:hypothetical protein FQR65_LT20918 [Abscondita terminalis]